MIQNYKEHPRWDDSWERKAYTQWGYLDQYPAAVKTLTDFAEKYPGHVRAAEFLNDAALVAERGGQLNQAIQLWEQLANIYPNNDLTPRAFFQAGITYFRLKDYATAEKSFQRYLNVAVPLGDKAAGQFWVGKALDAQGKSEAAQVGLANCCWYRPDRLLSASVPAICFITAKLLIRPRNMTCPSTRKPNA